MRLIGLTGGIATGKRTVSNLFKSEGFPVVDADVVARNVLKKGTGGWKKVVAAFGEEILQENGEVDREKLGEIIFTDPSKRHTYEVCDLFNGRRYEAWVIYNFLALCLEWVGGPGAVVLSLTGRVLKPNWCLMTCCFPPIPLDGRFIRRCKQGCLQFVILKPILVAITFVLYAKGKYQDGNFSARQSYLYITIIYTISYSMALYALALFYVACRDLLQPFNPVPKFIIIKSVVFLTYWQGVLVFLAAKSGHIKDPEEAAEFQNFIICFEMLIAAVGHLYAFPYKEYAGANIGTSRGFGASLAHALMLNDFYHDTVHQFAPAYHDYVLYNHSNDTGDEGARKYRTKTFVPIGSEMENVRKNKQTFASPTVQSPNSVQGTTKPEAMNSSLLSDASNSASAPYDFTLIDMDIQVPANKETGKK
ncbi:transmembrane protein 184A-like protein [Tanacetum coccineum]